MYLILTEPYPIHARRNADKSYELFRWGSRSFGHVLEVKDNDGNVLDVAWLTISNEGKLTLTRHSRSGSDASGKSAIVPESPDRTTPASRSNT